MTDTWRKLIAEEMDNRGDSFDNVVHSSLDDAGLDREFDSGFGRAKGAPFLLWTLSRVYFPVVYDGGEWVGSVPRDPSDEVAEHFGGD